MVYNSQEMYISKSEGTHQFIKLIYSLLLFTGIRAGYIGINNGTKQIHQANLLYFVPLSDKRDISR